jgi:hypothetical protein
MLQSKRSRFRFPVRSLDILNLLNASSRTMTVGLTATNRNGYHEEGEGKARPANKADNLTANCKPIV